MASKGVQDRVLACAPTLWAAFAYSEFVAEAIRRRWPRLEAQLYERRAEASDAGPEPERRTISVPGMMRGVGDTLSRVRERMVAADRARERQLAILGEERRRRDELMQTIYGRVVWARDLFEDQAGRRRTTSRLVAKGETPRDPDELLQIARVIAATIADGDVALPKPAPGVQFAPRVVGGNLLGECDALEAILKGINSQAAEEKEVISVRDRSIADFDRFRGQVGRFLESLLELVEMPTLASAVRPEHAGTRRGRPSKQRPRELFPDLVVAALALDPKVGLTLDEIRDRVPRRPVEYRRLEDVPSRSEIVRTLLREAMAFGGDPYRPPQEADVAVPERLEPEALGGTGAVDNLKGLLAGLRRSFSRGA